jgi:hypothetical protein
VARFFSGIGARVTPPSVLSEMRSIGESLAQRGWTLRSGHAPGADQDFEGGALAVGPQGGGLEVFLPWASFESQVVLPRASWCSVMPEPSAAAYRIAASHHPGWVHLSGGAKRLHARNAHIILGETLQSPVEFVVCWTPAGGVVGGTGQAIRIAHANGIRIINLAAEQWKGPPP